MAIIQASKTGSSWSIYRGATVNSGFRELHWAIRFCEDLGYGFIIIDKEGNELTV